MTSKLTRAFLVVFSLLAAASSAQAGDPMYGFQLGYTLGNGYSFRNRLPTPPYFSVYPPVYYGRRFERPYGDSPYAAFPQLQAAPNYYPVPVETAHRSHTVVNPHAGSHGPVQMRAAENAAGEPVAVGQPRVIVNPYAQEQLATKE